MRVVVSGASGFLGTHLTRRLRTSGHDVVRLVRRPANAPDEVQWDPSKGQLDATALQNIDAAVNLAGAAVDAKRWNESYKRELRDSRVNSTRTLAQAAAGVGIPVLVNAGGINWYGDTGDRVVDESDPPGESFLADLCRAWEGATSPAEDAGVRVVRLRVGYPLHRSGGYLKPQMLPFGLGIGGKLAGGRHWMPWIAMDDWLSVVEFVIARDDIAGPVNAAAPEPVRNAEFTKAFGAALHRPTIMPVPGFALRILLGELSSEALSSVRAVPKVLLDKGFTYQYPELKDALRKALEKR